MFQEALADLLRFVAKQLRALEIKRAKGNIERSHEIELVSDEEIVRKWLWIVAVVGAPVCFLILPFALSMLQTMLWPWLAVTLWLTAKTCMVLVFLTFILAAVFTIKSST